MSFMSALAAMSVHRIGDSTVPEDMELHCEFESEDESTVEIQNIY